MGKKLVYGVGISEDGEFARTFVNEFGKQRNTKEYELWKHMLERCYSDKLHLRMPTYKDCSTSENFKYFQYFANWCQSQIGFKSEGYQLDKDLVVRTNRVYSETNCVFVPSNINNFLLSSKVCRGEFPIGVSFHKRVNLYITRISDGCGGESILVFIHLQNWPLQHTRQPKNQLQKN